MTTKPTFFKNTVHSTYEERVRFHHFEISGVNARATVAYVMDKNRESDKRNVLFSYSICAPEDQFSKKKGRVRAGGRLFSPAHFKTLTLQVPQEKEGYFTFINSVLRDYIISNAPSFSCVGEAFFVLGALVTTPINDLPDICLFTNPRNGNIYLKRGMTFLNTDKKVFETDLDGNESVIITDAEWMKRAKHLLKT